MVSCWTFELLKHGPNGCVGGQIDVDWGYLSSRPGDGVVLSTKSTSRSFINFLVAAAAARVYAESHVVEQFLA